MRFCDFFVCETHFKGQQVNKSTGEQVNRSASQLVIKSTGQEVNRSAWPTVEASNKSQVTIKLDHTEANQLTIHNNSLGSLRKS